MATIELEITFVIILILLGVISGPFVLVWTIVRARQNPEFFLRIRHLDWIYALYLNRLGKLRQIVVPLSRVGEDGEIRLFKGTYFIKDKDRSGNSTVFSWRYGKAAYLFWWKDPFPQAWVPNRSLTSDTDPATVNSILNNKLLKQMMLMDFFQTFTYAALAIAVFAVILSGVSIYLLFQQSDLLRHLIDALTGSGTAAPPPPVNSTGPPTS